MTNGYRGAHFLLFFLNRSVYPRIALFYASLILDFLSLGSRSHVFLPF